ncbi:IS3 family transposase [Phaeobacter piscinae]|nr:IS3 family transposase [Phaeobacter piscinae]
MPFKLQLCQDIRAGVIGRRDAQRTHQISANLIHLWLTQFDRGELTSEEAEARVIAECEARIAALERKVGQLTMELDLVKKNSEGATRSGQREILHRHRPRNCSVRRGCKAMNLPRSTFYYRAVFSETGPTDAEIVALIEDIQDEFPRYGYRRVTHELRRHGLIVNHKKVARIMRLTGLSIKPRRRYTRTTDSRHDQPIQPNLYRNRIPDRPDQVWVTDFTYIRVAQGCECWT